MRSSQTMTFSFFTEHKSFYFSKSFFCCSIRTVSIRSFSKKRNCFACYAMSQDAILAANNQQFCCVSRISKDLCNTKSPTLNAASESYSDYVSWVTAYVETAKGRCFFFVTGSLPFGMMSSAPLTRNINQGGGGYSYNLLTVNLLETIFRLP